MNHNLKTEAPKSIPNAIRKTTNVDNSIASYREVKALLNLRISKVNARN